MRIVNIDSKLHDPVFLERQQVEREDADNLVKQGFAYQCAGKKAKRGKEVVKLSAYRFRVKTDRWSKVSGRERFQGSLIGGWIMSASGNAVCVGGNS